MLNIQDNKNQAGIKGAYVVLYDNYANPIKSLVTNQYGEVDPSTFDYLLGGSFVGIGADGYADASFPVKYVTGQTYIYLTRLTADYVPPTKQSPSTNAIKNTAEVVMAGKANPVTYIIISAVISIALYFIFKKGK